MGIRQAESLGQAIRALRPRQMGALPLVYPILTDLEVRQATNGLVPSQADIDPGRVVVLLTLNRLLSPGSGRALRFGHQRRSPGR